MGQDIQYSIGEWVVHSHYGVGQIRDIETKPLLGEQTECFKVKTKDSVFWFPANAKDNPRIRPIASEDIIEKVIKNLKRKPSNLEKDKKYWQQQINAIQSGGDLITISQLVRDLSAQQTQKRLNHSQDKALSKFTERLLNEWAAIVGTDMEKIRPEFHACIQKSLSKM